MTDREAMQQALSALEFNLPVIEDFGSKEQLTDCHRAITALYKSLAQPEQEPVAWIESLEKPQPRCVTNLKYRSVAEVDAGVQYIPLYTATPEQWVELTDSEILEIEQDSKVFDYLIPHLFARSIETKLKEKNT